MFMDQKKQKGKKERFDVTVPDSSCGSMEGEREGKGEKEIETTIEIEIEIETYR